MQDTNSAPPTDETAAPASDSAIETASTIEIQQVTIESATIENMVEKGAEGEAEGLLSAESTSGFSEALNIVTNELVGMWEAFLEHLPQLVIALVILIVTWIISRIAGNLVEKLTYKSTKRKELASLFEKLSRVLVWIIGIFVAMTVIFPSVTPGSLVAGVGIGGAALAFVFKDVFENFLAGILILSRRPFEIGDVVSSDDYEGKIEKINIRDSHIRQPDGQLIVVPNADLIDEPVVVRTDLSKRRVEISVGVGYGEDLENAHKVITDAFDGLETVMEDEPIQIFVAEYGGSSVNFQVTWWTGSAPIDVRKSRHEVMIAIKAALDAADVEIPFPYRTLTFSEPLPLYNAVNDDQPQK